MKAESIIGSCGRPSTGSCDFLRQHANVHHQRIPVLFYNSRHLYAHPRRHHELISVCFIGCFRRFAAAGISAVGAVRFFDPFGPTGATRRRGTLGINGMGNGSASSICRSVNDDRRSRKEGSANCFHLKPNCSRQSRTSSGLKMVCTHKIWEWASIWYAPVPSNQDISPVGIW